MPQAIPTPAPWVIEDGRHLGIAVKIVGPPPNRVEGHPPVPICEMFELNWYANALLITNAHTLGQALSLFLRTYNDGCRHGFNLSWQESMDEVSQKAKAALAVAGL